MVWIVVPAFNEEGKIGRVIRGLFEHSYKNVLVVDDGSSDQTAMQAREAGALVIRHLINRGQGAALQTGNDWAIKNGAELIVHFDGDGQFNPKDIAHGLEKIQAENLDVLLGSRFLDTRSKIPFFKKYFILPISRFVNNLITGLKLTDVHNGFRILNLAAAKEIRITQDGMAHNSEIPKLIKKLNLRYSEYPVEVSYNEHGQGIGGGFKILRDLFIDYISK